MARVYTRRAEDGLTKYQRFHQRHNDAMRSALATIKLDAGCVDCGYDEDPVALDFDHVRGEKSFTIGKASTAVSLDRLLDEVDKCDVRCANCHRIRTDERRRA
jgi:hypothetical protein